MSQMHKYVALALLVLHRNTLASHLSVIPGRGTQHKAMQSIRLVSHSLRHSSAVRVASSSYAVHGHAEHHTSLQPFAATPTSCVQAKSYIQSRPLSSRSSHSRIHPSTTEVNALIPASTVSETDNTTSNAEVKRLRWKLDLIDELESKLKREPLSLPKNFDLEVLSSHYSNRLFTLSGRFPTPTSNNVIFLGPRVRDGQVGYHVIQPFIRDGGGCSVLVDRGFVAKERIVNVNDHPKNWQLPDSAGSQPSHGDTCLVLLPPTKTRNSFTPKNDVDRHTWYFADVDEMTRFFSIGITDSVDEQDMYTPSHGIAESVRQMLGLDETNQAGPSTAPSPVILPVLFEQIFEGSIAQSARHVQSGIPVGRAATVELRNQHAVYVATWFSLSAVTSVMLALLIRRPPKG